MESIRPDEDELRAGRGNASGTGKSPGKGSQPERASRAPASGSRPAAAAGNGHPDQGRAPSGGGAGGGAGSGAGSGRGLSRFLLLLLILVTAAGAWGGWQLQQQVDRLEGQLEEADYWVRQSKLALARFEGELSETGESLEQRGSTLEQSIDSLNTGVKTANDEIRKLWVLANERNRPQIEALEADLASLTTASEALASEVEAAEERQIAGEASVRQALSEQQAAVDGQLAEAGEQRARLENELARVAGSVESTVERRLQRFVQEQQLTLDGLDGRLTALERSGSDLTPLERQLTETRNRLREAEQTLKAVDASRAQLTARLLQLQEQVDALNR